MSFLKYIKKMIELFPDVSTTFKKQVAFIVERASYEKDILKSIKMIKDFSDTCINESEKDFIDFYLQLKALELEKDESDTDQR